MQVPAPRAHGTLTSHSTASHHGHPSGPPAGGAAVAAAAAAAAAVAHPVVAQQQQQREREEREARERERERDAREREQREREREHLAAAERLHHRQVEASRDHVAQQRAAYYAATMPSAQQVCSRRGFCANWMRGRLSKLLSRSCQWLLLNARDIGNSYITLSYLDPFDINYFSRNMK